MSTPVRLTVPEPCHENWNQMTPNEQGRHCLSCQKTVVDFTLMSDQEILQHISTASSSVCGRFNNDQLNKTYQERKPRPSFTFRYMWQVMVSGFLWLGQSASAHANKVTQGEADFAKTEKPKKKKARKFKAEFKVGDLFKDISIIRSENVNWQHMTLGFVATVDDGDLWRQPVNFHPLKTFCAVLDEKTGKPLDSVSVRILGSKVDLAVDADGNFEFVSTNQGATVALEIEAKGYEKRRLNIPAYSLQRVEILMKRSVEEITDINALKGGPPVGMLGMVVTKFIKEPEVVPTVVPAPAKDVPVPGLGVETVKVINEACECANPLELSPRPAVDDIGYWVVKDEQTQQPVSFATVKLKDSETVLAADEEGRFKWPLIDGENEFTLVISAVGYETKELVITKPGKDGQEILLAPAADTLQAVEVRGWPNKVCHSITGAVSTVLAVPIKEKLTRSIKDTVQSWLPVKRDITAFPNPVQRGSLVNVQLNLKKAGSYKLELMDGAGRIVHVQALQVSQPSQSASLPTQSVWSAGIYWLRVTGTSDKKVYQAKLLVQ